jgi:hypothetical protein
MITPPQRENERERARKRERKRKRARESDLIQPALHPITPREDEMAREKREVPPDLHGMSFCIMELTGCIFFQVQTFAEAWMLILMSFAMMYAAASERKGNSLTGFKDF